MKYKIFAVIGILFALAGAGNSYLPIWKYTGIIADYCVAESTHIYTGDIVGLNENMMVISLNDSVYFDVLGVAMEEVDNDTGVDCEQSVDIYVKPIAQCSLYYLDSTYLGKVVGVFNEKSVAPLDSTAYRIWAGILVDIDSCFGYIDMRRVEPLGMRMMLEYLDSVNWLDDSTAYFWRSGKRAIMEFFTP